jgi:hypothetical protein
MKETDLVSLEIIALVTEWYPVLSNITEESVFNRKNSQNRTIRQILGHTIDSTTNNTHRIVHLHYQPSPLIFPNYATFGNNDRWIEIQDYQNEDWKNLVQLWKYSLFHLSHLIKNVAPDKLTNEWISGPGKTITLEEMIIDFPRHLKLHLSEISDLLKID